MAGTGYTRYGYGGWEGFLLNELPIDVLTVVLSKTTPGDVGKLALVNKKFAEAASSDLVWKEFLPTNIKETVQMVPRGNQLTNHVRLADGTTGYWVDRDTGGVCLSFSARTLRIQWSENPAHWDWVVHEGSRFGDVAYLKEMHFLDLSGDIKCRLPPGIYTLSWVLQFDKPSGSRPGWRDDRAHEFRATNGSQIFESDVRKPLPSLPRHYGKGGGGSSSRTIAGEQQYRSITKRAEQWWYDQWWEYTSGEFMVTRAHHRDRENLGEMTLKFSLETDRYQRDLNRRASSKGGMWVDGVILRSSLSSQGNSQGNIVRVPSTEISLAETSLF